MTISAVEDWLVRDLKAGFDAAFKSIESGPGEWSDAYLKRVISQAPALRVAFLRARPPRTEEDLTLDSDWVVYVLTGWSGGNQATRRRGKGTAMGSYRAVELIAPRLHHRRPEDADGDPIPTAGLVHVSDVENMWSGDLDQKGLALFAIGLDIEIALDPEQDGAALDDFLRAGVDWNIPEGADVDAEQLIDLPQE